MKFLASSPPILICPSTAEGQERESSTMSYALLLLLAAIGVLATFIIVFVRAPLFYDEANYLTLALAIRETGYPIWFWDPERPELFLNSPPLILYLISLVRAWVSSIVVLRLLNVVLFALPMLFVLPIRSFFYNRSSLMAAAIATLYAVCSGPFLWELMQLRFDLPLACLTILTVVWWSGAQIRGWSWISLSVLFALTVLLYLTKFQAVCVTGALFLYALIQLLSSGRTAVAWPALLTHLAAATVSIAGLALWSSFAPHESGGFTGTLSWNLFDRMLHGISLGEFVTFVKVLKKTLTMIVVPGALFCIACAVGAIDWKRDPLLQVSASVAMVVVIFNLIVFRFPGAGGSYMVQAIIPLGYMLGRSVESLMIHSKAAALVSMLLVLIHGVINVPPLTEAMQPDFNRMAAKQLEPVLRSEDLLLLDDPSQSRAIPYILNRYDRYGYLLTMHPPRAEGLLERAGSGKVGALVLSEQAMLKLVSSPEWLAVARIIGRDFVRGSVFGSNFPIVIYFRRSREGS
jgi:hypothetical protein